MARRGQSLTEVYTGVYKFYRSVVCIREYQIGVPNLALVTLTIIP